MPWDGSEGEEKFPPDETLNFLPPSQPNNMAGKPFQQVIAAPEASEYFGCVMERFHDLCSAVIAEHERLLRDRDPAVRKDAPESAVTLVTSSGYPTVCVKQLKSRGAVHVCKSLFRPTQGMRTFRNGRLLNEAGVRAARPLILARRKWGPFVDSEWVLLEVVDDALELDRYILRRTREGRHTEERRGLVTALARFLGMMHHKGIFHADLKTCNILVTSESAAADSPGFCLLDYDDVRFFNEVPFAGRVKNLVQIFLSAPLEIGLRDRMRFLREYARTAEIAAQDRRRLAREVLAQARGRDILYVGFDGDVIESWDD